jgi:hypothetical protein
MTRFYVQREAGIRETVGALAVALGVGGFSYYLARMLLAREDLDSKAPRHVTGDPDRRQPAGSEGAR